MNVIRGNAGTGRRGVAAAVGLAAAALTVVAVSTPASAAPGSSAAAAPSTSPSVPHKYYPNGNLPRCPSGYGCALVAYGSGYYRFSFYKYGTYYLSHWLGRGAVTNAQTGGAAVRLYDVNGKQIDCVPAAPITAEVNWNPVWKIRLTASGC